MANYESSPEGRLWHHVLATFIDDAGNPHKIPLTDFEWRALMRQAESEWIKTICLLIDIDHGGLIKKMKLVREKRLKSKEAA